MSKQTNHMMELVWYQIGLVPMGFGTSKPASMLSGGGAKQRNGCPPDSQGLHDKVQLKKKRLFGGARRRHGRPSGSQGPTIVSPASAIALKDSSMLSVGIKVRSWAHQEPVGERWRCQAVPRTPTRL
jgi:hypothetical protein